MALSDALTSADRIGSSYPIQVQVLGPVRAWREEHELRLGGPTRRAVLGMLAMRANHVVSRGELIDGLWGEDPPDSAVNGVHVHVAGLRRVLEPRRARRAPAEVLRASGPGYLLRLDAGQLDADALDRHLAEARRSSATGDLEATAGSLDAALGLWHGAPLSGIPGPWAEIERARLSELRLGATEERVDVTIALGGHQQAAAQLAGLIREHPLRERFRGQIMLALYRSGRQADALAEFAAARRELAEELGIEPGPALRRLHQQILAADAALDRPNHSAALAGHGGVASAVRRPTAPIPRELPADVDWFTGRADELGELDRMLRPKDGQLGAAGRDAASPRVPAIAVISGTAGVGKTALAVHWAHRLRDAFPDGQLYVNLHGYDPAEPLSAADALARFLRALGVADQDIPADTDERAARCRSVLDGRQMLIVLDNAASVDQVRPLLPGSPSCTVVVTSRDSLAGLVVRNGARRMDLDLLPPADAVTLIRALIGGRAEADPAAADTLAGQCARLPLALRVAAELAAARPALTLAELVDELADEQRRLELLDAGGDPRTAVRGVFSWSYRHLPADAARVFRLIGVHPGPDLDAYAAAALAGVSLDRARDALDLLARAHLIQPARTGRYAMHDLLRAYAVQLSLAGDESRTALTRLFDYYLAAAAAAMDILVPAERNRRPLIATPATPLPPLADGAAVLAWLDAERATFVAVAGYTAARGWPGHSTRLSAIVCRYVETGGHYADAVAIHTHACHAARATGDRTAEAHALNHLGFIEGRLGRHQEAGARLHQSLALFREVGDRSGAARALSNLASADRRQGRYQQAASHDRQALAAFCEVGDSIGEARVLNGLGLVEWQQGGYERAARYFQQALALFRELGDRSNEAHALGNLGMVIGRMGHDSRAADHLEQALALLHHIGDRSGTASVLTDLGSVACRQHRYQEAAGYQHRALALFRTIGERSGEAEALNGLGEVLLATGQPGPAHVQHAAALDLAGETGDTRGQARAHNGLGAALLAAGLPGQAHAQHAAALALASQSGDRYEQDRARDGIAFSARPYTSDGSRPGSSRRSTAGAECPATTGSPHDSHTSVARSV